MLKSELVASLAESNPHLTIKDVERVVDTILDTISDTLADGGRVEIRGFGAFSVKSRGARVGRNPRNGEKVEVEAKNVIGFKAGKEIRDALAGRLVD